jgi:hypothetical protein
MTQPADRVRYRLWVAEVDDEWAPRTRPDRPSLWVGITLAEPSRQVASLRNSRRDGRREVGRHIVRPRLDLCDRYPAAHTKTDAERQRRKLMAKLRRRGHTVNRTGTIHHVYIIELDDGTGPKEGAPDLPWLYVGQTSIEVADRIEQHRTGARNDRGPLFSRKARHHFVRPRPDLFDWLPPTFSQPDAEQRERWTADLLREVGYSVHQA